LIPSQYEDISGRRADLSNSINTNKNNYVVDTLFIDLSGRNDSQTTQITNAETRLNNMQAIQTDLVTIGNLTNISNQIFSTELGITDISVTRIPGLDSGFLDVSSRYWALPSTIELSNTIVTTRLQIPSLEIAAADVSSAITLSGNLIGVGVEAISAPFVGGVDIVIDGSGEGTYFNSNVVEFRGDISFENSLFGDIDILGKTPLRFDKNTTENTDIREYKFTAGTPHKPTHYIMIDNSNVVYGLQDPSTYLDATDISSQMRWFSNGGAFVNLKFSRLSSSRHVVLTIPPGAATRLTIGLYDDDDLSNQTIYSGIPVDPSDAIYRSNWKQKTHYRGIYGEPTTIFDMSNIPVYMNIMVTPGTVQNVDFNFLYIQPNSIIAPGIAYRTGFNDAFSTRNLLQYYFNFNSSLTEFETIQDIPIGSYGQYGLEAFAGRTLDMLNIHNGQALTMFGPSSPTYTTDYYDLKLGYYQNPTPVALSQGYVGNLGPYQASFGTIPGMYSAQPLLEAETTYGNKIDIHFTGVGREVFREPDLGSMVFDKPPGIFDYYSGNTNIFDIYLISTGGERNKRQARIYIKERTRISPQNFFYTSVSNISNPPTFSVPAQISTRQTINRLTLAKIFRQNATHILKPAYDPSNLEPGIE
jgi:hypothetical protein